MTDNPPPPVDRRISIKDVAKRCGLEVRKMPSPIIFVNGIKIIAKTFRFKDVDGLKDIFRGLRSGGVGRIYLHDLKDQAYLGIDGKNKKAWLVRIGYNVNVGFKAPPKAHARKMVRTSAADIAQHDALIAEIEHRMLEYSLTEGN